jgi:hypothetical protein
MELLVFGERWAEVAIGDLGRSKSARGMWFMLETARMARSNSSV